MPSPNPDLTPTWQLPSPKPADPPDIPGDIKALADRVDAILRTGFVRLVGQDYASGPAVVPGSFTDICTVTGTTHGGPVILLSNLYVENANSGDWRQVNMRLRSGSTSLLERFFELPWKQGNPRYSFTQFATHAQAAGSGTWTLGVSYQTAAAVVFNAASLLVLEVGA